MMKRHYARAALLVFAAWTGIGLLFTGRSFYYLQASGQAFRPGQVLLWNLIDWYAMGAFTPIVVWLARRFRIEPVKWIRSSLIHLLSATVYAVLSSLLYVCVAHILMRLVEPPRYLPADLGKALSEVLAFTLPWDLVVYGGMVAVTYAVDFAQRYRQEELSASRLETQLAQAQLQLLKMQLQPHFLFNTLNAIAALVHSDADAAERMIARLADLLRYSLDMNANQEVPLEKELQFLDKYIEIQKTRFRERLTVEMSIAPDTLNIPVPNLILQPIVENAIHHGISPRAAGGRIQIRATRHNGSLELEVLDDGVGLAEVPVSRGGSGVGLSNTRGRLQRLYGAAHRFEIGNAPDGGAFVRMVLPIRPHVTSRPTEVNHVDPSSDR